MPQGSAAASWVMPDLSLSSSQRFLLRLSREVIRQELQKKKAGPSLRKGAWTPVDRTQFLNPIDADRDRIQSEISAKRGCFVTLWIENQLRGCIGTFSAQKTVAENVEEMARAAAFHDPRFSPLSEEELDQVKIEISILGPLEKIDSDKQLEIGRHGIFLKHGKKGGTFLPDVAVSQHWSSEEFVRSCAFEKAGLSAEELSKAELFRYEVEKFSETGRNSP